MHESGSNPSSKLEVHFEGMYKMEGFYGKHGGWGKEAVSERKNYLGAGTPFLFEKRKGRVFIKQIISSLE